jgi:hypothetical protein
MAPAQRLSGLGDLRGVFELHVASLLSNEE